MSRLAHPHTCTCGHVVYDTEDAKTVRAGRHTFVFCNACVPKIQAGVKAVAGFVGLGLSAFINKRYPGALAQLRDVVSVAQGAVQHAQAQGKSHAEG